MPNREPAKADVLQGTLDLMVLQTLETLGALHGYAIAARLEQVSAGALQLNMGTLYPALMRLEQRGLVRGNWGTTDSNRKARFYALTVGRPAPAGQGTAGVGPDGGHHADAVARRSVTRRRNEMRMLREWVHRVLGTLDPRRRDRELEEELRSHLELATDDAQRRGHTPEDAARAARIRAGGVSQAMDALRDQRGLPGIDALVRDLRFGARMLAKDRWITLAAVVALAIGIAANNTVFTIVNAILLRDLPFDQPDRIVAIGTRVGNVRTLNAGVSYADFQDWRAAIQTFEGLGAMRETTMNVGDERVAPERFIGSYISANAFGLLRQRPILGRDFFPDDDRPWRGPRGDYWPFAVAESLRVRSQRARAHDPREWCAFGRDWRHAGRLQLSHAFTAVAALGAAA